MNFLGQSEFPVEVCVVKRKVDRIGSRIMHDSGSNHDTEQHPELSFTSLFRPSSIGSLLLEVLNKHFYIKYYIKFFFEIKSYPFDRRIGSISAGERDVPPRV